MLVFEPIIEALNASAVRYVVVGGLAVVLHGYVRVTADIDVVLDLDAPDVRRVDALVALGLRPSAPVDAADFADPETRRRWIAEKGMVVFSLIDPDDPFRHVDLFVESPGPFEDLWQRASVVHARSVDVRIASVDDLIDMKRKAGRPRDVDDVEALEALRRREEDT